MSNALSLEILRAERPSEFTPSGGLLEVLLREQQSTAVDKFAQWHHSTTEPLQARHYRDLIPLSLPEPGQQYAFEVDLDRCSGCKACVVACHNLNGLEEDETWRSVGLLHGGSSSLPVLQHVTTACHHCLEPPCLEGCPVLAYEKDPVTGIVRHLDDQCIGCQYCVLRCPYEVPKYSHEKGIVRKCDMCSDRLAVGEAPACVQSCPNQAIRITVVDQWDVAENAEANLFLPGAPEPSLTLPTTIYKTTKPLPVNLLPADYYSAKPQHAHWPLVIMLVLTQMSVGAFLVDQVLRTWDLAAGGAGVLETQALHWGTAFGLGMIGLAASVFHLGRPLLAYRAIIGWRTSWLSREVIAFGIFAVAASTYAASPWLTTIGFSISPIWQCALGLMVALSGLAGVACSTMIYASTRRIFWNAPYTGLKFLLTSLVLGIPICLQIHLIADTWMASSDAQPSLAEHARVLCVGLLIAAGAKLLLEAAILSWLRAKTFTPLRRTALLMTGDLGRATFFRFLSGIVGGLVLPGLIFGWLLQGSEQASLTIIAVLSVALVLNFTGELLERYLFFAAVIAPKMPGAPTA